MSDNENKVSRPDNDSLTQTTKSKRYVFCLVYEAKQFKRKLNGVS